MSTGVKGLVHYSVLPVIPAMVGVSFESITLLHKCLSRVILSMNIPLKLPVLLAPDDINYDFNSSGQHLGCLPTDVGECL